MQALEKPKSQIRVRCLIKHLETGSTMFAVISLNGNEPKPSFLEDRTKAGNSHKLIDPKRSIVYMRTEGFNFRKKRKSNAN